MAPSEPSSLFPFPYRGQESPELPPSEPVTVISIADHAVIVQWSSSPFGKGGPDGSPKFSLRGVAPYPTLAVGQEERQAVFPPYSSVALRFRQALSRHILTRFARSGIPRCLDDAPARHGSQWRRTPGGRVPVGPMEKRRMGSGIPVRRFRSRLGWHIKARPVFAKVVNGL